MVTARPVIMAPRFFRMREKTAILACVLSKGVYASFYVGGQRNSVLRHSLSHTHTREQ
jgi:hypothetical protein